jgi:hypothetical protein
VADSTEERAMEQSILTSKFDGGINVPANLDFVTDISPDGQAVTIIFSNLFLSVEPFQPAIRAKVFTLNLPYCTDQPSVTMTMDLRGAILADAGMDVRLVACAGDTTKVVDVLANPDQAVALRGTLKDAMVATHSSLNWSDFQDRVEFTVQTRAAKPVCQITLFLVVEHNTDTAGSEGAVLVVDSMDLEIVTPGKGAFKL